MSNEPENVFRKTTADFEPPRTWRAWLIGRPLSTADAPHQAIGKAIGLAVFSSDALSSVAYATQEILVILAYASIAAFHYAIPISIAIVALLFIVTISYEQTIHAYPGGGGAYIVARDNLGDIPALVAGAALLTDYILTVAVSVSSGVAQIVSAYPEVHTWRVEIAVFLVLFVMLINLRGVKESGYTFAVPTYFFLIMMSITLVVGLYRYFSGDLITVVDPPHLFMEHEPQMITLFLLLRAFAGGTTALTGVEAISNGIMAFKEPRSKNAGKTLLIMSSILGVFLLIITFFSVHIGAIPSESETVISQIGRTVFEQRGILYLLLISATTVILIMAANTAYADFPRLSALIANDGFLPRQLSFKGSRLVFSRGIMVLAFIASALIVLFQASVTKLIPLYAIGVFISFTLSQGGMALRWWKVGQLKPGEEIVERGSTLRFEKSWETKMLVNGFGACCTFVVMLIFAYTKFLDGAWIVVILTPSLVLAFMAIHHHYRKLAKQLSLENFGAPPLIKRHRVIMPISGVHRGSLAALRYARMLSDDVTVVHVAVDETETEKLIQKWETWGEGRRLVILESSYRLFVEPLIQYIEEVDKNRQPDEVITIVVPQFVPRHWWGNLLHTQTAVLLRLALTFRKGIVVTDVPYLTD